MKTWTIKKKYKNGQTSELPKRPIETVNRHLHGLECDEDLIEITLTRDDQK